MQKLRFILIASLLCCVSLHSVARTYKVLFLGNSYVGVNDLPGQLRDLAINMGDSMQVTSVSPGGFTLNGHWSNAASLAAIATPGWDFVIIQAQSQEPSFPPAQVTTSTMPYAKSLDSFVKASNTCAEVMFYMTWGRKYGDPQNCGNYSVLCTYDGMQDRLRDSYIQMATTNNSSVCPAGQAWRRVRQIDSTIELYQTDYSHPTITGTFLVACAFYNSIYHKPLSATSFVPTGVSAAHAAIIRNACYAVVMDSIETWQGNGNIPLARFTATPTALAVSINNTSKRSTNCNWYWGDGTSTMNAQQATQSHTYTIGGTYTITLVASNACKYDSTTAVVEVVQPNNIAAAHIKDAAGATYICHNGNLQLVFAQNSSNIEIVGINGTVVYASTAAMRGVQINISNVPSGIYFLCYWSNGKQRMQKVLTQ